MIAVVWPEGYAPMWPHDVERLLGELSDDARDEDGEPITAHAADWAIQGAMEHERDVEGWGGMPDISERIWGAILPNVLSRLGLDEEAIA